MKKNLQNRKSIRKSTKKLIRKSTKKLIRKSKGGAPENTIHLGTGSYGCAYEPGLKCLGQDFDKKYGYISKLMYLNNAYNELCENLSLEILNYDPAYRFHLSPPTMCNLDINDETSLYEVSDFDNCIIRQRYVARETRPDRSPRILNYKNGGLDLYKLENNREYLDPRIGFGNLALQQLLQGIINLQEKGFAHCDIKSQNIVSGYFPFDYVLNGFSDQNERFNFISSTVSYKLIDFGFLSLIKELPSDIDLSDEDYEILNTKDILSGPYKKINLTNLGADYFYYPIYGIFIDKTLSEIISMTDEEAEDLINTKITDFIDNNMNHFMFNKFATVFNLWDPLRLLLQSRLIYSKLKLLSANPEEYYKFELNLVKKIDFYSFGVVLLEYLSNLYLVLETEVYNFIETSIFLFLRITQILDNNYLIVRPEIIMEKFNETCASINQYLTSNNFQTGGTKDFKNIKSTAKQIDKETKEISFKEIEELVKKSNFKMDPKLYKISKQELPYKEIKVSLKLKSAIDNYMNKLENKKTIKISKSEQKRKEAIEELNNRLKKSGFPQLY